MQRNIPSKFLKRGIIREQPSYIYSYMEGSEVNYSKWLFIKKYDAALISFCY